MIVLEFIFGDAVIIKKFASQECCLHSLCDPLTTATRQKTQTLPSYRCLRRADLFFFFEASQEVFQGRPKEAFHRKWFWLESRQFFSKKNRCCAFGYFLRSGARFRFAVATGGFLSYWSANFLRFHLCRKALFLTIEWPGSELVRN